MAWEDVDVGLGDKSVIAVLDYSIAECIYYCSLIFSSSCIKMTDHSHFSSQLRYKASIHIESYPGIRNGLIPYHLYLGREYHWTRLQLQGYEMARLHIRRQ